MEEGAVSQEMRAAGVSGRRSPLHGLQSGRSPAAPPSQ